MSTASSTLQHVAIIMDGNGRWAKERGLPRIEGHKAGAQSVRTAVEACLEADIPYLTLYAFSSENWKRPVAEVDALMLLLEHFLKKKINEIAKQGVRLSAIGRLDRLPQRTRQALEEAILATQHNEKLTLILSLSYGGREEIVDAAKALAQKVRENSLRVEEIDNNLFADHLYTAGIPDPDLLIRTSGEMRLSNFLLWQLSYSELYMARHYWPDFRKDDLYKAIAQYRRRHRRFGVV